MEPALQLALTWSIIGGIARTAFLTVKAVMRKERIYPLPIAFLTIVNAGFGALLGLLLVQGKIVSFIAGWAGMDVLDGLQRTIKLAPVKLPVKTVGIMSLKKPPKKSLWEQMMEYR
ncbi:hypothetical protein HY493_00660 [Candidatus Woesearchaeota archaeon]|nr:hypothetical protein [Candidatus Woesearchaeota archaeon]